MLAGCVLPPRHHRVDYAVTDVPILAGGPLSQYTLIIHTFTDHRPAAVAARTAPESSLAKVEDDNKTWYATSDDRYSTTESLQYAVTSAIATHLRAAQLFHGVQMSDADAPATGDLVMTGDLLGFEGLREERDTSEALVGMHGLIGLALEATQTIELRGKTKLGNVKLTQVSTDSIIWQGDVEGSINENVNLDPGKTEQQTFDAANRSLRAAVNQMLRNLAQVSVSLATSTK